MKHLNIYTSTAAYEADTERKNLGETAISLVKNDILVDGVNVETTSPQLGDAVYADGKRAIFIKSDTLDHSKLSHLTPVGVCGVRKNNQIYIIAGQNAYKKFAEFYRWKVSGWNLDNAAHVCAVELHGAKCADFTYNAQTLQGCADQLNTYLKTNAPKDYQYIAYIEDEDVMLQLCNYTSYQSSASIASLTVSQFTAQELPEVPNAYRLNGSKGLPVWNTERAIEFFRNDQSNNAYNPSSPIGSIPSYPVCLPAYLGTSTLVQGDNCAYLRGIFGEGEGGWLTYMRTLLPIIPYPSGLISDEYLTGLEATKRLAGQMVDDGKGVQKTLYPAADYCNKVSYPAAGLEAGNWFFHTAREYIENFSLVRYGLSGGSVNDDPINRTLSKMKLNTVACNANSWLASRNYGNSSLIASSSGNVDSSSFCYAYRVVPLSLYTIQ